MESIAWQSRVHTASSVAKTLGLAAVRALYAEVALEPKPGLVSFRNCGSHTDMNAQTFMRSLFALRGYFPRMALAGHAGEPFAVLQGLGQSAETRMLAATCGINTHRGAIFGLGLLCASAGQLLAQGLPFTPQHLRTVLLSTWGEALAQRAKAARLAVPASNGQLAARRFGLRSAGDGAAQAFPVLFDVTLPALQAALQAGAGDRAARVQALFATMAELDDTNCVHRGGIDGLRFVQTAARQFLQAGGVLQADWMPQARAIHNAFVACNLSPGGAADVLASACWVQSSLQMDPEPSLRGALATRQSMPSEPVPVTASPSTASGQAVARQSRLHGLLHCVRNDERGSLKAPPELVT